MAPADGTHSMASDETSAGVLIDATAVTVQVLVHKYVEHNGTIIINVLLHAPNVCFESQRARLAVVLFVDGATSRSTIEATLVDFVEVRLALVRSCAVSDQEVEGRDCITSCAAKVLIVTVHHVLR